MRVALAFAACWLLGCGGTDSESPPTEGPPRFEIVVDGVTRVYRLAIPADPPEGAMPLLLLFQGGDGGDYPFPQEDRFLAMAEAQGVAVARPVAELLEGNEGAWLLNAAATSRRDLDFVEALIDDVASRHAVDPTRIYATGYSLGSMFTYELACHLSSRFAAIASFAGTMPVSPAECAPEDNVPIMHLHGEDDWLIAYSKAWDWKEWDAVGTMMDIPSLVAFWKDRYGCRTEDETRSGASVHIVHSQCEQDARVEHHRLVGVEHDWPEEVDGVSTHQVMWSFLSEFSKSR